MKSSRAGVAVMLAGGMFAAGVLAQDLRREEPSGPMDGRGIANWAAPPSWSPGETAQVEGDGATLRDKAAPALTTSPAPFIGITPCRIVDTRNSSYPAGYGPPQLSAGVPRVFTLAGQCGIPDQDVQAVSLNITVVGPAGLGYVLLYPEGGAQPNVSTLNFTAGQTVANAAIVPLSALGGITVAAALSNTQLLIDTNGYYAAAGASTFNTFLGINAGNFTMTGSGNTAIGAYALFQDTDGFSNTTIGINSMYYNTSGRLNTAIGNGALYSNTTASYDTALGYAALQNNTTGEHNTASGQYALSSNTTGTGNTAIGSFAGTNLTAGDHNLYLANDGAASESGTIRVGSGVIHTRAFIAAVRGVTTGSADAVPVVIDSNGQLGTTSSSVRYKDEIEDMSEASSGLLKLRPVTFRYKSQAQGGRQFGLIAEEVEEILPELVVHNAAGEVETVLYHQMPAMLLNELQKQQRTIEQQAEANARQDAQIGELLGALEAMKAQIRAVMEGRQGR